MLRTRIVFVDGLPGSGKSMTAEYVASELEQRGLRCRLLREREPDHPLNVGGDLHPSGSTTGTRMFAAYTIGSFVEESLARWNAFVAEAIRSERVTILDSYPFQNSLRVLLQMDADSVTLAAYQSSVEEVAAGLDPVLIYLDPGDAESMLRAIAEQRGPAWTDYAIAVVTECPYASSRHLHGMDGAVAILQSYKLLLDESVARCRFPRLALSGCHRHWHACHARIREFLRFESSPTAMPPR
jgi:thymidylate kinase